MVMNITNERVSRNLDLKAPEGLEKAPSKGFLRKHLQTISKTKFVSTFILGGIGGAAVGGGLGVAFTGATLGIGFKAILIGAGAGFVIGGISAVGAMVIHKTFKALGEYLNEKFSSTSKITPIGNDKNELDNVWNEDYST